MLWYPFHASNTLLHLSCGTVRTWWKGDCVWWVSLVAWVLRAWKSTVRHGFPVFLGQITIWWHQVTGVPIGTGSITPNRTSWSSPAFTSSFQCKGTGIGVWWATGSPLGVNQKPNRWARHHRQGLVFACVERTVPVVCHQKLAQFLSVGRSGCEG